MTEHFLYLKVDLYDEGVAISYCFFWAIRDLYSLGKAIS